MDHADVTPPSTTSVVPVVNDAASDKRYTAAPASSGGWAWRPSGVRLTTRSRIAGFPTSAEANRVSTRPGAIALTRILLEPSSAARV